MNLASILSRCQQNAEKWEARAKNYRIGTLKAGSQLSFVASGAASHWRSLEKEIGEELDREAEWLLNQVEIKLDQMSVKERQEALRDAANTIKNHPESKEAFEKLGIHQVKTGNAPPP